MDSLYDVTCNNILLHIYNIKDNTYREIEKQ